MSDWLIGSAPLAEIEASNSALAHKFFDRPEGFVADRAPAGWLANSVQGYASYAAYESDHRTHSWVRYDNEHWAATPANEQLSPREYMSKFCDLAHSRGAKVILTPARDLTNVSGGEFEKASGETSDQAYIRHNVAAAAAKADVFECQAQADQANLHEFTYFVTTVAQQRRAGQTFWCGLTTMRAGNTVNQLLTCYHAVNSIVDGYWLNVGNVAVAVGFLNGATP